MHVFMHVSMRRMLYITYGSRLLQLMSLEVSSIMIMIIMIIMIIIIIIIIMMMMIVILYI
jgi:hypothetical protein